MNKKRKLIISLPIIVITLWLSMVIIDYMLSTKVMCPIFAQSVNASDVAIFRGIGYTIVIDDGYTISPPDSELKGYFYWGWR